MRAINNVIVFVFKSVTAQLSGPVFASDMTGIGRSNTIGVIQWILPIKSERVATLQSSPVFPPTLVFYIREFKKTCHMEP